VESVGFFEVALRPVSRALADVIGIVGRAPHEFSDGVITRIAGDDLQHLVAIEDRHAIIQQQHFWQLVAGAFFQKGQYFIPVLEEFYGGVRRGFRKMFYEQTLVIFVVLGHQDVVKRAFHSVLMYDNSRSLVGNLFCGVTHLASCEQWKATPPRMSSASPGAEGGDAGDHTSELLAVAQMSAADVGEDGAGLDDIGTDLARAKLFGEITGEYFHRPLERGISGGCYT
jgi:hypothetical protein